LGDNLAVEYGAEYLMAVGPHTEAASLRPSARVIMQLSPTWIAAMSLETEPGTYAMRNRASLESALDTIDALPVRVCHNGTSNMEGGWHQELAARHDVGRHGKLELATFHDFSEPQAVSAYSTAATCDLPSLQYCSTNVYAHDAGAG